MSCMLAKRQTKHHRNIIIILGLSAMLEGSYALSVLALLSTLPDKLCLLYFDLFRAGSFAGDHGWTGSHTPPRSKRSKRYRERERQKHLSPIRFLCFFKTITATLVRRGMFRFVMTGWFRRALSITTTATAGTITSFVGFRLVPIQSVLNCCC